MNDETESQEEAAVFEPTEARILACLMEKELTTPDNYPLTINSLTLACNQKTNREPVLNLSQGEVGHLVNELAERNLIKVEYGERANRVRHRMNTAFTLSRKQQAILSMLMLRRPMTLNEIRSRTQRMVEFDGLEEVLLVTENLMERDPPLVVGLPKGPGRREDRYAHTLCGALELEVVNKENPPVPALESDHEDRIAELERRVELLEAQLGTLVEELKYLEANDD